MLDVPSLVNNGTLIINRSNLFNYEGVISGSGVIVKQGGRQWRLAGLACGGVSLVRWRRPRARHARSHMIASAARLLGR
jgi:hypothetical protein